MKNWILNFLLREFISAFRECFLVLLMRLFDEEKSGYKGGHGIAEY